MNKTGKILFIFLIPLILLYTILRIIRMLIHFGLIVPIDWICDKFYIKEL